MGRPFLAAISDEVTTINNTEWGQPLVNITLAGMRVRVREIDIGGDGNARYRVKLDDQLYEFRPIIPRVFRIFGTINTRVQIYVSSTDGTDVNPIGSVAGEVVR